MRSLKAFGVGQHEAWTVQLGITDSPLAEVTDDVIDIIDMLDDERWECVLDEIARGAGKRNDPDHFWLMRVGVDRDALTLEHHPRGAKPGALEVVATVGDASQRCEGELVWGDEVAEQVDIGGHELALWRHTWPIELSEGPLACRLDGDTVGLTLPQPDLAFTFVLNELVERYSISPHWVSDRWKDSRGYTRLRVVLSDTAEQPALDDEPPK